MILVFQAVSPKAAIHDVDVRVLHRQQGLSLQVGKPLVTSNCSCNCCNNTAAILLLQLLDRLEVNVTFNHSILMQWHSPWYQLPIQIYKTKLFIFVLHVQNVYLSFSDIVFVKINAPLNHNFF